MWTSISVLLLLIYFIFRRLQNKTDEEQTSEEPIPSREPSEYRLSAVRALPTITEENPTVLSPSNSSNKFTPLSTSASTILPLAIGKGTLSFVRKNINHNRFFLILDESDSRHSSSTSLRQRKVEKADINDIDDFVQIPPIIQEKPYHKSKDSTKIVNELPALTNEAGHPIIFRMFNLKKN